MLFCCGLFFRISNRLDPDQAQHFVEPDLGPPFSQRSSADDTLHIHCMFRFYIFFGILEWEGLSL